MKSKKKKQTFHVTVKVVVETSIEVPADTLEEAIQMGREFDVKDVAKFDTDYIDGSIEVIGAFEL